MVNGARTYLAIQGGFDVPLVMASASTDLRGGFGGVAGRRLQAGDLLRIGNVRGQRQRRLRAGALDGIERSGPIRVTRGAQNDWFGPDEWTKFLATIYSVSEQSDRAGLRLRGEAVYSARGEATPDRWNSFGCGADTAGRRSRSSYSWISRPPADIRKLPM